MSDEPDKAKSSETQGTSNPEAADTLPGPEELLTDPTRRRFFQRVAIGGGAALTGGAAAYAAARISLQGLPEQDYPQIDEKLFKPKDQRDVVLTFVSSKTLNEKHPERNEQYNRLQKKAFDWLNGMRDMYSKPWDNRKPGYTQMDRALQKAGWTMDDVDLVELNEAFAAQVLADLRGLSRDGVNIPLEKLNVNGGAIAIGHPIGASGARVLVTLIHALKQRGLKRGIAALCLGGGEAVAMAVELEV